MLDDRTINELSRALAIFSRCDFDHCRYALLDIVIGGRPTGHADSHRRMPVPLRSAALYTGFFHKRFIEGIWVVAEGAIYKDSWSEDLLYDQRDEPPGLRATGVHESRIIAIDYGTTNPMVFLDIYDDGKVFWIVREYYWDSAVQMRQKTDAEYADDLVEFIGYPNNAKVIIDPSAASFKTELMKRGIWHMDADDDVNEGIRIASMVLNQRLVRFCRQTVQKTIQEMQTYAWDAKAAQRGEEKPSETGLLIPSVFVNNRAIQFASVPLSHKELSRLVHFHKKLAIGHCQHRRARPRTRGVS
jgi:hypothetical protein